MQIISDCCAGAYIYRDYLKIQYPNPFIWNTILLKDMYNLIKNYHRINFNNIELIRFKDHIPLSFFQGDKFMELQYNTLTGLRIDNIFNVFWTHNYYDKNAIIPRKQGGEVFYYKNYELTLENWNKRIIRLDKNEKPIFMIITQKNKFGTREDYVKLLNDFPNENIVIITADKELLKYNTQNHRIYYNFCVDRSPEPILKEIYNELNLDFS